MLHTQMTGCPYRALDREAVFSVEKIIDYERLHAAPCRFATSKRQQNALSSERLRCRLFIDLQTVLEQASNRCHETAVTYA